MKLLRASLALGLVILAHTASAENDFEEANNNEPETEVHVDGAVAFISDDIDADSAEASPAEEDGAVRTLDETIDRDKIWTESR